MLVHFHKKTAAYLSTSWGKIRKISPLLCLQIIPLSYPQLLIFDYRFPTPFQIFSFSFQSFLTFPNISLTP